MVQLPLPAAVLYEMGAAVQDEQRGEAVTLAPMPPCALRTTLAPARGSSVHHSPPSLTHPPYLPPFPPSPPVQVCCGRLLLRRGEARAVSHHLRRCQHGGSRHHKLALRHYWQRVRGGGGREGSHPRPFFPTSLPPTAQIFHQCALCVRGRQLPARQPEQQGRRHHLQVSDQTGS